MTSPPRPDDAHPYLRAATAGIRHHTRALERAVPPQPVGRVHLDVLHAHLTALHRLLDRITESTQPPHPAAGRQLATAHARLWQATTAVHDAFHLLPHNTGTLESSECDPERLPEGPPVLTICQRHLAAGHAIRRKATPTDLNTPLHGHTTACAR
ncbi:DUF6238 family protein [Streptomyces niveus]|uniref:DUF6238 family protein n=1 Tax=Streptomyces niveus TaxID=193462 RepID=UPI00084CA84D|nr:DUF6238 family protein [Streptomyces niveus]